MRRIFTTFALSLFAIVLLSLPAFGIDEVESQAAVEEDTAHLSNAFDIAWEKMVLFEMGEPQEIVVLYDYLEAPRFVLAVSGSGYLIMDIPTGLVLESGKGQNPYVGYEGTTRYYGGFGLYFARLGDLLVDVLRNHAVESVAHLSTVDDIRLDEAYAPDTQQIDPDGSLVPFMTASATASSKQLPYTYAYIQRLSFGNNTRDTCTAVATGLALNYLDNAIDGAILPNGYQAEPLKD